MLKKQKGGLKEALGKHGTVVEIDWQGELRKIGHRVLLQKIARVLTEFNPEIILCQFHNAKVFSGEDIRGLRGVGKGGVWVNWIGDYLDFNKITPADLEMSRAFDLQLVVAYDIVEECEKRGIRPRYWQISWEPEGVGYEPNLFTPRYDVLFLANNIPWYPIRRQLVEWFKKQPFKFGLYGIWWPLFWAKGSCLYDFKQGCRLLRAAKIVLADNPRPGARGFISNRLFQSLAAGGAMLMLEYVRDYQALGFVDGKHFVIWQDQQDLLKKIAFWLRPENDAQRRAIALAGQELCLREHSFDARVNQLFNILSELKLK